MPESRWVARKIGTFWRAEFSALVLLIRVRWGNLSRNGRTRDAPDEPGKALAVELLQHWQDIDVPLAQRCPRSPYLKDLHDAELIPL